MILILILLINLIDMKSAFSSCTVGIPDDCKSGEVCAKYNAKADAKCFSSPKQAPIVFDLPFDSESPVVCTQSTRYPTGTHAFRNMLYAIDLATPFDKPSSTVRAAADGVAYVYSSCPNPKGPVDNKKTDDCGLGLGNHIKILHEGSYMSLYAHLEKIYAKTGDKVLRHQAIGLEGASGQASHRHLHWDVNYIEGTSTQVKRVLSTPGWGGISVPFKVKVNLNGVEKTILSSQIACSFVKINQVPWTGTYKSH